MTEMSAKSGLTFRKSFGPPEKIHSPLFTHSPPKNKKMCKSSLFHSTENSSGLPPPPTEGGEGEETMNTVLETQFTNV